MPNGFIKLTVHDDYERGEPALLRVSEIVAVRPYAYHSCRPKIAQILLTDGTKIAVDSTVEDVEKMIEAQVCDP